MNSDATNRQFPAKARTSIVDNIVADIQRISDEQDLSPYDATAFYCMDLYGLGSEDGASRSDGTGDRGIDWYRLSRTSAEIYQFKGTSEITADSIKRNVAPSELADLRRIVSYIRTINQNKNQQNRRVSHFQKSARLKLESAAEGDDPTFFFDIYYFLSRSELSKQAEEELNEIRADCATIEQIAGVLVEVKAHVRLIDDIAEEWWRQDNQEWKDSAGKKSEWIELNFEGKCIDDGKCIVFFCRGFDLIKAYDELGHRLFAPNVRCFLHDTPVNSRIKEAVKTKKVIQNFRIRIEPCSMFFLSIVSAIMVTPVNSRIKEAVKTKKGIQNFRYMNNGVT
ncbi:MAG: hypothetical protein AAGL49_11575, partial [Pseudomonadota bacterium]